MEGPALLPGNKVTELQTFTIHAVYPNGQPKTTGGDLFESMVTDPRGAKLPVNVVDNNNGTWTVTYMPTDAGKYHIEAIQRNPSLRNLFDHIKVLFFFFSFSFSHIFFPFFPAIKKIVYLLY